MASLLLTKTATSTSTAISFSSAVSISLPWRVSSEARRRSSNRRYPTTVRAKIREIFMPALSSTMTEGKIVSWVKSEGDKLSKGESVVVVESDKADMDVETFYDGILAAIVVAEGETAPVGSPIGLLAETEDEVAEAKAKASSKATPTRSAPSPPPATSNPAPEIAQPPPPPSPGKIVATPYAKKLAKQHKVDIASVVGTGPFGRITPSDVEAKAGIAQSSSQPANVIAQPSTAAPKSSPPSPSPAAPPPLPGSTIVPFTTMQAAVSKNMVESLSVPTFRVGYPVITDALDALYEKVSHP